MKLKNNSKQKDILEKIDKLNESVLKSASFGIEVEPIVQDGKFFSNGRDSAKPFRERVGKGKYAKPRHNIDDEIDVGNTIEYMSKSTKLKIRATVVLIGTDDTILVKTLKTNSNIKIKRNQILDIIESE